MGEQIGTTQEAEFVAAPGQFFRLGLRVPCWGPHGEAFMKLAVCVFGGALAAGSPCIAQLSIGWSTVDGGGGVSSGGVFTLSGTIGQPDAGSMSGGAISCLGGYWAGAGAGGPCYANCDASTQPPVLNVGDFSCFLQKYAAGDAYANCDQSTQPPTLNVQDFSCFLQKYAAGCP
jgi:hypothetical protein